MEYIRGELVFLTLRMVNGGLVQIIHKERTEIESQCIVQLELSWKLKKGLQTTPPYHHKRLDQFQAY